MGLARNLALEKFPGIYRDDPSEDLKNNGQVPELALPCSQIDDYLKCHYRTFIKQLMA